MQLPEWSDPDRRELALQRLAARLVKPDPLSKNELGVLFLTSHGIPQGIAAEWLHLAPSSVTNLAKHARWKMYAATSEHAVATALRLGLFS